jgi:NADH:ubiquinone reductase (non-electrogenic)
MASAIFRRQLPTTPLSLARGLSSFASKTARTSPLISRPAPTVFAKTTPTSLLQLQFRRAYADAVTPVVPKKRRFRFFTWLWRATYLSAIGSTGWLFYHVYELRNPAEQEAPDPKKKTLVILGSGWGAVSLLKKLDTENYNVIVISPRNYFLFTPLLPSCATGAVEHRSIMEPLRNILRQKKTTVTFYEAAAQKVDHVRKVVHITDESEIRGDTTTTEVPFDYLVMAVGTQTATFGIPGVQEHSVFLKEVPHAQMIRSRVMDCIETAIFKDQSPEEVERLLHMVVVGGGPTGVEFAAELHDWFEDDLKKWIPEIADNFHVTLVEALPNLLPSFSKQLVEYTEKTLNEEKVTVRTKTMVKKVTDKTIEVEVTKPDGSKTIETMPYGLLVWATGNAVRPVVKDLMQSVPAQKDARRGLKVNEYLVVEGTEGIWALGDCSQTSYAPTAQVATQEGAFLARIFNSMGKKEALDEQHAEIEVALAQASDEEKIKHLADLKIIETAQRKVKIVQPFQYSHQGSLAYIGADKAVADISWFDGNFATGGALTYLFWRSAYLSMCFSGKFLIPFFNCLVMKLTILAIVRNRILVVLDWSKSKVFGRDVSRV